MDLNEKENVTRKKNHFFPIYRLSLEENQDQIQHRYPHPSKRKYYH